MSPQERTRFSERSIPMRREFLFFGASPGEPAVAKGCDSGRAGGSPSFASRVKTPYNGSFGGRGNKARLSISFPAE
jgi:hypothetical protein